MFEPEWSSLPTEGLAPVTARVADLDAPGFTAPATLAAPAVLNRNTALRLGRDVVRLFLELDNPDAALAQCARLFVEKMGFESVTMTVSGAVAARYEAAGAQRNWVPASGEPPGGRYARSVPILGEDETLGTLEVAGTGQEPGRLEPFLELIADDIAWCLARARRNAIALREVHEAARLKPSTLIAALSVDTTDRVTSWNEACCEILGWQPGEAVGLNLEAVLGGFAYAEIQPALQAARDGWSAAPCDVETRSQHGVNKPLRIEVMRPAGKQYSSGEIRVLLRDESRQVHLQRLVELQSLVSSILAGRSSIEPVVEPLLREIGRGLQALRGEWVRFDAHAKTWSRIAEWKADALPEDDAVSERSRALGAELAESVRRRNGVLDFDRDELLDSRNLAFVAAHQGFRDIVGVPVSRGGEIGDVLLFFNRKIVEFRPVTCEALLGVGRQIAMVANVQSSEQSLQDAENRLVQAKKMESVGLVAGGVAHDFNNLLTIILGSSEIALDSIAADSDVGSLLKEIEIAGNRGAALTRQLLAFSRQQPMESVLLNVSNQLSELEPMLQRLVEERIRLEIGVADSVGMVRFDPTQFDQIMLNLVVNARDAIPGDGTITVGVRNATLSVARAQRVNGGRAGEFVVVSVADTGCGMDRQTQSRVFEPFFTTKGKGKGTGMGLSTVYGVVNQCGGFLDVDSEPGRGTRFDVYLPRSRDLPRTLNVQGPIRSQPTGGETILVVDDEESLRKLTARMLEIRGYSVCHAGSGREALQILKDRSAPQVDLLLTDVRMPGMSGLELVSQMRDAGFPFPVLFMSGHNDTDVDLCDSAGRKTLLLRKPFTSESLSRAVRDVLDGPAEQGESRFDPRSAPRR